MIHPIFPVEFSKNVIEGNLPAFETEQQVLPSRVVLLPVLSI
jgi:hypothetical protein